MSRRCTYVTSCFRRVRFVTDSGAYCLYHWHKTRLCECVA